MKQVQFKVSSPVGILYLVASENGLRGLHFSRQSVAMVDSLKGSGTEIKILSRATKQLNEYFLGERRQFDLPFDLVGTDFQKRVWSELSKIPYGVTRSYLEIAARIKNKKACRAVGAANGKNPISIMIPCHRVITTGGKLGGYSGGLSNKVKLLSIEHVSIS